MKFTNKHGLPKAIEDAICRDIRKSASPDSNYISVTSIIDSPKILHLKRRHWDEIEEDIGDRIWALLGTAVHSVLDKAVGVGREMEKILKHNIDGWAISGMSDIFEDGTLSDYKVTSVWSVVLEGEDGKIEWERQLNCYAYLWRVVEKREVNKLQIIAILRDWQKSKSFQDPDYPRIPIAVIPIRLWSEQEQRDYLSTRLALHLKAKSLKDDEIPPCSEEERWHNPNTYAVMKKDMKRALRVLPTRKEAEHYVLEALKTNPKQTLDIVERNGGDRKCQEYCSVNKFCNFYKEHYAKEDSNVTKA